jgi:5-methylcytosine-specific restriction protein B
VAKNFTWIPIYEELAKKLVHWQDKQAELISFLEELRTQGYVITPLNDRDQNGNRFLLKEIDPFTFFGVFNRGIRYEQRLAILARIREFLNLENDLPEDMNGLPVLNNLKSWFFAGQTSRQVDDVAKLWRVFQLALGDTPLKNKSFLNAFDQALAVKQINVNLTMGLFWIRPDTFLNLDQYNRNYLEIKLPSGGLNAKFYVNTIKQVQTRGQSFAEISLLSWGVGSENAKKIADAREPYRSEGINYWLVGAYWSDQVPPDQTERFLQEGIWENGYHNRYLSDVRAMHVGDRIAIKSSATQRKGMPFDNRNRTVSRMTIKAIGTIVANRNDGRLVEVEWDGNFVERNWYFYTNRSTLWKLRLDDDYKLKGLAEQLRDFVWYDSPQDYDWFLRNWYDGEQIVDMKSKKEIEGGKPPYGLEDVIASGVFLDQGELEEILDRLRSRKALILQGPPGVGKTFLARKLAYALMEEIDPSRLEMIQFHQSYSYDDFVRGYRPLPGKPGTFGLQDGVFHEFCQKAIDDPDHEYVFIIDEINRGNLSQIFGELLMLVERDKRGPDFSVPLVYRKVADERFYVPSNLYLIGLMNLADRSLAMVDYALRRRFAFVTLHPQYESETYRQWLSARSMDPALIDLIIHRLSMLNQTIREDPLLGENYQLGHSFFCPEGEDLSGLNKEWYQGIIRTEVAPLLREYWFDDPKKAQDLERQLLA